MRDLRSRLVRVAAAQAPPTVTSREEAANTRAPRTVTSRGEGVPGAGVEGPRPQRPHDASGTGGEANPRPGTPDPRPYSTVEQRVAIDDLGLEIVGRGAPDPLLLAHLGLRGAPPERWEDILFLDTETTGLAGGTGTYVFLLGTACLADGELVLRQHVLHDLGAERDFVAGLHRELDRFRACASYNGKCFDLPLLRTRVILALRAELTVDDSHLDLLHPARRLWRGRFGSTGLRQLEDSVLDEPRLDDIPGALIPERYFAFLRTGDARLLAPILAHNLQDIVSLVRIADHVARAVLQARRGRAPDHAPAALALARVFERTGEHDAAFYCYESAYADGDLATRVRAALPYARALERRGEVARALSLVETLLALGQGSAAWRASAEARLRRLSRRRADAPREPRVPSLRPRPGLS